MDIGTKVVALVTGGNRGIGKQVSLDLTKLGVYVIVGCRNPEESESLFREIRQVGDGELLSLDVSKEQSITTAYDTIFW